MNYPKNELFSKNIKHLGSDIIQRLSDLKIAIVGAGGTGIPVFTQLCGLGIKNIKIIDGDKLSISNLNRQFVYCIEDIGKYKSELAKKYIEKKGFEIEVSSFFEMIDPKNIDHILNDVDVIFDCVDNFKTTFLLDEYCVKKNKILVHSGVNKDNGQVFIVNGKEGRNIRSFFADIPEEEENINIITSAMFIGALQVNEFLNFVRSGKITGMIFVEFYPTISIKILKV